ncbi:hypothetical protein M9458_041389, partial [Cirrhinus mrigala]
RQKSMTSPALGGVGWDGGTALERLAARRRGEETRASLLIRKQPASVFCKLYCAQTQLINDIDGVHKSLTGETDGDIRS